MAKRTGLGKGLGAIFGDEVMESAAEEQEAKHQAKSKKAQEPEKKEEPTLGTTEPEESLPVNEQTEE